MLAKERSNTCATCRLTTNTPALLVPETIGGMDNGRFVCPRCHDQRASSAALAFFGGPLIAFAMVIFADPTFSQPRTLPAAVFIGAFLPMLFMGIIMHELLHAGAGLIVGMQVNEVCFGRGQTVTSFFAGGTYFRLRRIPIAGYCISVPRSQHWIPLRRFFTTGAPLAVHLSIVIVCLIVNPFAQPWRLTDSPAAAVLWCCMVINAFLAVSAMSLAPTYRNGKTGDSDLVALYKHVFERPPVMIPFEVRLFEFVAALESNRVADAERALAQAHEAAPDTAADLLLEMCQLFLAGHQGQWEMVRDNPFAQDTGNADMRFKSWIVFAHLCAPVENSLDTARRLSRSSMVVTPWDSAAQTVEGCVLLCGGSLEKAQKMLESAWQGDTDNLPARAANAHAMAECWQRWGNEKREKRWQRRARRLDPENVFRPKWEAFIGQQA